MHDAAEADFVIVGAGSAGGGAGTGGTATGSERPSSLRRLPSASTATNAASVWTRTAVSRSANATGAPSGVSWSGAGPARTCQRRISVAPFQLAHTATREPRR